MDDVNQLSDDDIQLLEKGRRYHKSRHQHYKQGYKKLRYVLRYLVLLSVLFLMLLVVFTTVYMDRQRLLHRVLNYQQRDAHLKTQIAQLETRLSRLQLANYRLTKARDPDIYPLTFSSLIALSSNHVYSVLFEHEQQQLRYQLLYSEQPSAPLVLELLDESGEHLHSHRLTETIPDEGLQKGEINNLDFELARYFRIIDEGIVE